MAAVHTIEFWPYVKGFTPEESKLDYLDNTLYLQDQFLLRLHLERDIANSWSNVLKNNQFL